MAITVTEDAEEIIVDSSTTEVATIENTDIQVTTTEVVSAIPNNDIELVVTSDDPELFIQHDDVEIVVQTVADSVVKDMYIINPETMLNTLLDNSIPGSKLQSLPVNKLTDGGLTAKTVISNLITAATSSLSVNYNETNLTLGDQRVNIGKAQDRIGLPTYLFRHSNGYDSDHASYVSNFSIQSNGQVSVAGIVAIQPGSTGLANLVDAGALAVRDTTTFYSDTIPTNAITGDIWYDTLGGGNTAARFNGSTWDSVKDSDLVIAQGAIDGKIQTYWQGTAPTGLTAADNGDLWFDTANGNKVYYYDDLAIGEPIPKWRDAQDSGIAQGISDASTAQATADGKIVTYTGASFPVYVDVNNTGTESIGDLFYNTSDRVLYRALVYPVGLIYDPLEWEVAGNGFINTYELDDTIANLGGTADWALVADSLGTRPADNADVTNVGGSNYVVRGLTSPNSTSGSVGTVAIGAGNWGFQLPNSTAAAQVMTFNLPVLSTTLSYVVGFWAYASVVDAEVVLSIPNTPVQHTIVLPTTPTYYSFDMSSNDVDMATAVLQFTKTTTIAGAASTSTIYDVMFEQGVQSTDWVPFNPVNDAADQTKAAFEFASGVEITSGGLTMNAGGAIRSTGITTEYTEGVAGFWLGYNSTSSKYTFGVGDGSEGYIKFDGTELRLGKDVQLNGADAFENDSFYYHTYFESSNAFLVSGGAIINSGGCILKSDGVTTNGAEIKRVFSNTIPMGLLWTVPRAFKIIIDIRDFFSSLGTNWSYLGIGDIPGGSTTNGVFIAFRCLPSTFILETRLQVSNKLGTMVSPIQTLPLGGGGTGKLAISIYYAPNDVNCEVAMTPGGSSTVTTIEFPDSSLGSGTNYPSGIGEVGNIITLRVGLDSTIPEVHFSECKFLQQS